MKIIHYALLVAGLISFESMASSIECADTIGHRLEYRYQQSDGGAYFGPTEHLVVDGNTLIERSGLLDMPEVINASIEFREKSQKVLKAGLTEDKNYKLKVLLTKVVVKSLATGNQGALIFDDIVTCKTSDYIGLPIP